MLLLLSICLIDSLIICFCESPALRPQFFSLAFSVFPLSLSLSPRSPLPTPPPLLSSKCPPPPKRCPQRPGEWRQQTGRGVEDQRQAICRPAPWPRHSPSSQPNEKTLSQIKISNYPVSLKWLRKGTPGHAAGTTRKKVVPNPISAKSHVSSILFHSFIPWVLKRHNNGMEWALELSELKTFKKHQADAFLYWTSHLLWFRCMCCADGMTCWHATFHNGYRRRLDVRKKRVECQEKRAAQNRKSATQINPQNEFISHCHYSLCGRNRITILSPVLSLCQHCLERWSSEI